MTTAAIYIRVSSPGQEQDGTSLETQLEQCHAYAAEHGYSVSDDHIYREVHTGIELWQRPKLTALREAIRRREVEIVICHAIDRLSRDPVHLGVILSEAEHAGVDVQFVTEPLDNSPEAALIRFVRGYSAKVEHEKFKERSIRARIKRARDGKPLPAQRAPYGYRWRDAAKSGYDLDPLTAPIVQRIFADAAAGVPANTIAKALTAEGIPSPSGKGHWGQTTVTYLLKCPVYTGAAVALAYSSTNEPIPLPASVAPPLVSAEIAASVRTRLSLNKRFPEERKRKDPEAHLLRGGHVRCWRCGSFMQASAHPTGPVYICRTRYGRPGACPVWSVPAERLDADVWAKIYAVLTDEDEIARVLNATRSEDPTASDLASVERRLSEVMRQQRNLVAHLAELDSPDVAGMIRERLADLTEQRRVLEHEREAVLRRRAEWEAATERLTELQTWFAAVRAEVDGYTYEDKRHVLARLNIVVTVERLTAGGRRGPGKSRWTMTGEAGCGSGFIGLDNSTTYGPARTRTA